jgi:type II secretory pathway component PulF
VSSRETVVFVAAQAAVVTSALLLRAHRRRNADELRIRILESLAAAARRGVPLGPLLERASEERRGRVRGSLQRLADDVENGVPLADALEHCRALALPGAVAASIRAAQGTASLADALSSAARDETAARLRRHRTWGEAAYPILLLAILLPVALWASSVFARFRDVAESMEIDDPTPGWMHALWSIAVPLAPVAVLLAAVTLGYLLHRGRRAFGGARRLLPTWSPLGEVPPFRGPSRLAGAAAFLGALSAQVRGGVPLDQAALAAAVASRNLGVRRGARRMAEAVAQGEPSIVAWDRVPLPASIRPRAAGACSRAPGDAARSLDRLADECRARLQSAVDARVRWIAPAGIAIAAYLVGSLAFAVFGFELTVLRSGMPTW